MRLLLVVTAIHQKATTKATKPKGARTFTLFFTVVLSTHISPVSTDDYFSSACYFWRILTCTVISPDFSNANVRGKWMPDVKSCFLSMHMMWRPPALSSTRPIGG